MSSEGLEVSLAALLEDFSLEMTGKDLPRLEEARGTIPPRTRINITFLANEDLAMRTAAAHAVRKHGFTPVPHISARRIGTEKSLEEFLTALRAIGASENLLVIAGDLPEPQGPYQASVAILRSGKLEAYGARRVSVAGYPEGHPQIAGDVLWTALTDKAAALEERGLRGSIITQFGFDAGTVLRWVEQVRQRGITLPVRVGVPGPAGVRRLLSYASRFGVSTSAGIARKYGLSLTNLVGTAGPDGFIRQLAGGYDADRHGDIKLHFYTFGGLSATSEWISAFRQTLGAAVTERPVPMDKWA
ncbi:MAG: methylenetetrahydrofolate reductase [Actinobacteria bacterium]|nr:methylenetetrahydrofolate reductase [Actinomycetota bacterium]